MHVGHARFVWNLALEQCDHARKLGGYADQKVWDRQLAEARQHTWLGEGSSSVQQAALRDLRQAFRNWWSNPGHFRYPTFRSRHRGSQGFVVRDLTVAKINRKWATVVVPKVGPVRFRLTRPVPPEAKSARVTLDRSGRWHVSFVASQPTFERTTTGSVIGLDMGVVATVTTSNGEHLTMPETLTPGEKSRRARLQRRLARQTKGSNRRQRTKQSLACLSAREVDRRNNWIEQTTTALVRDHDLIVVEDLKITNMVRSAKGTVEEPGTNVAQKRGLNRSIHAQSWGRFRTRLTDKAAAASSTCMVISVNPANTSRRCSGCGHTSSKNRESQAIFRCQACDHTTNADVNAAINIRAAGLVVHGRGGDVRPGSPGSPTEASTARKVLTP